MGESLFALVEQSKNVMATIIENGGELTPELESALAEIDIKVPAKIDSYVYMMERLDLENDYWTAKAEQFSKVSKACRSLKERLKENIKLAADELGTDELKGIDHRFKLSNSKPKLVLNETLIEPLYYMQVTTTVIDKKKIEEDLKAGVPVTGAELVETKSLRTYVNKAGK